MVTSSLDDGWLAITSHHWLSIRYHCPWTAYHWSPINCWSFKPAESFLISDPVETIDHIFVLSPLIHILNGIFSLTRGRAWLLLDTYPLLGSDCWLSLSHFSLIWEQPSPVNWGWFSPAQWSMIPSPTGLMTALGTYRPLMFITQNQSQDYFTICSLPPVSLPWPQASRDTTRRVRVTLRLAVYRQPVCLGPIPLVIEPESELLYDWRFTASQFVLAPSLLWSEPELLYDWRFTVSQFILAPSLLWSEPELLYVGGLLSISLS
jgi:hypothetical protein